MNRLNNSNIFFSLFRVKDELSLEEIYAVAKRPVQDKEKNRQWIGNKLSYWRTRELAEAMYGSTGSLTGIKLTERGKALLEKPRSEGNSKVLFLMDAIQVISQLRREHPEYEITFEIRLKENKIVIQLN
jgi:hypothetical protein